MVDGIIIYLGIYRPDKYLYNGRIYNFMVRDSNGILKYNLIPCYRKIDNTIGFYDLKTHNFYTNSATTGEW